MSKKNKYFIVIILLIFLSISCSDYEKKEKVKIIDVQFIHIGWWNYKMSISYQFIEDTNDIGEIVFYSKDYVPNLGDTMFALMNNNSEVIDLIKIKKKSKKLGVKLER